MQVKHAAIAGSSIGLLAGIAICTVIGASFTDSLFRVAVLAVAGAWMGVLLVWLNDILMPRDSEHLSHGQRGRRP